MARKGDAGVHLDAAGGGDRGAGTAGNGAAVVGAGGGGAPREVPREDMALRGNIAPGEPKVRGGREGRANRRTSIRRRVRRC